DGDVDGWCRADACRPLDRSRYRSRRPRARSAGPDRSGSSRDLRDRRRRRVRVRRQGVARCGAGRDAAGRVRGTSDRGPRRRQHGAAAVSLLRQRQHGGGREEFRRHAGRPLPVERVAGVLPLGSRAPAVPGAGKPTRDGAAAVAVVLCHEPARLAPDRRARRGPGSAGRRPRATGADGVNTGSALHAVADVLKAASTPAQSIVGLSMLVMAVCGAIFVVVAGVLAYTMIRFRRPSSEVDREPPQVYGSSQIEIAWTVIPVLIVIVLTMATARVITEVQDKHQPDGALAVTVIGHQWWWEIRYPALGVVTANELHVPVSEAAHPRPTFLRLESADVAHSFWVPQLAGKTD